MTYSTFKTLSITAAVIFVSATFTAPALAVDEHNVVPGLTATGKPLGLHGIDPVSFLDIGNRIGGTATYTAVHDDVAYYFSTEKNKTAFLQNPAKYAPQNGGFCTFGVSVGKKFNGNPNFAAVKNGKLFVFLNEDIFNLYQKDERGTINKAEQQWKKIKHTAAVSL